MTPQPNSEEVVLFDDGSTDHGEQPGPWISTVHAQNGYSVGLTEAGEVALIAVLVDDLMEEDEQESFHASAAGGNFDVCNRLVMVHAAELLQHLVTQPDLNAGPTYTDALPPEARTVGGMARMLTIFISNRLQDLGQNLPQVN